MKKEEEEEEKGKEVYQTKQLVILIFAKYEILYNQILRIK